MSFSHIAIAVAALLLFLVAITLVVVWRRGRRRREDVPAPDLGGTEAVVLAHGLMGFESIGIGRARQDYFRGVRRGLERAGVPTFAVRVAGLGSVPERAQELAEFVRTLDYDDITIVGHSMGGLDARYAISKLGLHDRVRALITIGTPHRGTALADLATTRWAKRLRSMAARVGVRSDALDWLTTESLTRFNAEVLDHPNVAYFSVVGRAAVRALWRNPLLLGSHLFLRRLGPAGKSDGGNDGLVTVASQQWGETLEEIDADHFAQIGWSMRFRAAAFYLRLIRRAQNRPIAVRVDHPQRQSSKIDLG